MTLAAPPTSGTGSSEQAAEARHQRAKGCYRWLVGGLAVVALLLAILAAVTMHQGRVADRTEAINNLKNISTALLEFERDYGRFPDESTAAAVKTKTGTTLTLGSGSSNELFRQLLVSITKSERSFLR